MIGFLPLALVLAAPAGTRDDYGYAWQLDVEPGRGAYRIELSEPVYARISDLALRDLEVFDARGVAVPMAPADAVANATAPAPARLVAERRALPWFALTRSGDGASDDVTVRIERDETGRLRAAETDVRRGASEPAETVAGYVVDASELVARETESRVAQPIAAFELAWTEPTTPSVQATLRVSGSDDFEHWNTLGQGTLVDFRRDAGQRLTRRRIVLPQRATYRYYRFDPVELPMALAITEVYASIEQSAAGAVSPLSRTTLATPVDSTSTDEPRSDPAASRHEFRTAGAFAVERLQIELPKSASVAELVVRSRASAEAPWTQRATLTAFRLATAGEAIGNEPVELAPTRDRHWQIEARPKLASAPSVLLSYRPDAFVLLEQGEAPYVLMAGSGGARRPDYPLAAPIAALRRRLGNDWQPAVANLGAAVEARGDAALAKPSDPASAKRYVLWAVLIAGALALVAMVVKLVREPSSRAPRD